MAFTGKPLAINGAQVEAAIFRRLANFATKGESGVMRPDHCRVVQTPTASGNVRIMPGTVTMASRYPGAAGLESYMDTNTQAFDYPTAPTTAAAGRTDWIVARVEDPDFPGQSVPANRLEGPYTKIATLSADPRVSPPAYPFMLLAKITIPAGTTNITAAMIDSGPAVREVANPRHEPMSLAWNGRMDTSPNIKQWELTNRDGNPQYWMPYAVADTYFRWEVPAWATQFNYQYTYGNVYNNRYDCWGFVNMRMVLLEDMGKWVNLASIDFDTTTDSPGQWSRDTWTGAGRINIPSWARGKTVSFRPIAAKVGGNQAAAKMYLGAGASISMSGTFMESAIDEAL